MLKNEKEINEQFDYFPLPYDREDEGFKNIEEHYEEIDNNKDAKSLLILNPTLVQMFPVNGGRSKPTYRESCSFNMPL